MDEACGAGDDVFPTFQPGCYIQNGTQLFRVVKRVDPLGHPAALRLQLEDAYRYTLDDKDERRYTKQWYTYSEVKRGEFELVKFTPAELPARFLPAVLSPAPT